MRTVLLLCLFTVCALAGPPFQTDDPEPIDFRHYEFYTFATADGTRVETDTAGPAVEFNWGALPNVHLHVIIPRRRSFPVQQSRLRASGDRPAGVRYWRYRTGRQIQICAGDEKASDDRYVRYV